MSVPPILFSFFFNFRAFPIFRRISGAPAGRFTDNLACLGRSSNLFSPTPVLNKSAPPSFPLSHFWRFSKVLRIPLHFCGELPPRYSPLLIFALFRFSAGFPYIPWFASRPTSHADALRRAPFRQHPFRIIPPPVCCFFRNDAIYATFTHSAMFFLPICPFYFRF